MRRPRPLLTRQPLPLRTLAGGALTLALLTLPIPPARAQTAVETGTVESANARVFPFLGARFGVPQRLSVSAGIGLDLDPGATRVTDPTQASRELLLALAPGLGAERASLTYVYSTGRFGGGLAAGASVLRTIRHPWHAPANATYVGADLAILPFIALGPRVGLLRRVSAPTREHAWLWTVDFGFGF